MNTSLLKFFDVTELFYIAMETQDRFSVVTILYLVHSVFIDVWQRQIIISGDEF